MYHFFIAALFVMSLLTSTTAFSTTSAQDLPVYSIIFDDQRDPFSDANAAIKLAGDTNRNVLIEVGGNWCTWCHVLDRFLEENPDVAEKLHANFVVLKINVSDSNENEAFMKSLPPVLGYPHMYVSEPDGNVVLSKDTAEFQVDGKYSREKFLAFFQQWQVKTAS